MNQTILKQIIFINIFLKIIFVSSAYPQLVINEIMYVPSESNNEWFEIFNAGNSPVNLQNCKWKDATSSLRTITVNSILLDSHSYAVICQDSVKFKLQFPGITGILIQTVWSQLNNTGDNLILIASDNSRDDSVSFLSTWGGNNGGFSLEKKISSGSSNNSSNWSTSVDFLKATPDRKNSVTPKQFDLFLKSFFITPLFPTEDDTLKMEFTIKNTGINTAGNFYLNIFEDANFDSISQNNELLQSRQFGVLNSDDSLKYNFTVYENDTGKKQFIAVIVFPGDNDTLNNILIRNIYKGNLNSVQRGIVINEIMYDPLTDNPEWIEFFNTAALTINLKGWKYKESYSQVTIFSNDFYLNPGDYLIITRDSTIYNAFPLLRNLNQNQKLKLLSSMSLNNSGESVSLTDSLGSIVDMVDFRPSWNNPNIADTKGISLEKINPLFKTNEASSWSSCTKPEGGTPGLINSIYAESKNTNSELSISPNPFSPDGDGIEDFTIMKYRLNVPFAQLRVKVFDIKGRLVRTLADNAVSGKEGTIVFNGLDNGNIRLRIGIYILLIEAIDDNGGIIEIKKAPFVIATRL